MRFQVRRVPVFVFTVLLALGMLAVAGPSRVSAAPNHDTVVNDVPPGWTPAVDNGEVLGIAQSGNVMVAVGGFTSVTPDGGNSVPRDRAFAFDATSGALVSGFAPTFNGSVEDVIPGPSAGTVYVAGTFTRVNGQVANRIALLRTSNGSLVTSFSTPGANGKVNTIFRANGKIYAGGNFSATGNEPHAGLAAYDENTGALDSSLAIQVDGHHNDTGSGAQGPVGVRDLEVTPDGTRLVAIGNFKRVDGLPRDQLVVVNLTGTPTVAPDWRTRRYEPYCFNWAFDTYVRGVSISPDGSYFVVATTGGQNAGSLCDTAARFETGATGDAIQPTWVNYSGGDTLWGVTVTEKAVYVGGHQRWMNNSSGSDFAGQGAVPRPGLAGLDVDTGLPISWNPGRNPRGAAVYAMYATPAGLWMGSDTLWVGDRQYRRPRLAFFPLAGGAPQASDAIPTLPGTAYIGGGSTASQGNILYRVNAGGPTAGSADAGPDWTADDGGTSPYRNSGSNAATYSSGATTDGTVPSSTPNAVFDSERWSPSDNPSLQWAFPVQNGVPVQVRLFFSNRYSGTSQVGQRVFDVLVEGQTRLDDFDIVAATGDQRGTMRAFDLTSDGTVNIELRHVVENPLINAIEIVRTDQAPPTASSSLRSVELTATGAGPATSVDDQGITWSQVRGAFVAGGKLWYGVNGGLRSRPFDGGALGSETTVDPYNDPEWAGVATGSGSSTFDGRAVELYSQMSGVTGMAYADGRLYYTRTGDSNLYWRWFNTDSGIIGSEWFTANGGRSWNGTSGMFVADDTLYFVTSEGNLNAIGLTAGVPSGSPSVVDGPSSSGTSWKGRAVFLARSTAIQPNEDPTAAFDYSCVELICDFDASGSSDADGQIDAYAWDFDPGTESGQMAAHTFAAAGTYAVSLTVRDNRSGTDTLTRQVTVEEGQPPAEPIAFVDGAATANLSTTPSVTVPAGTRAGDTLVLTGTFSNLPTATTPSGWTLVGTQDTIGVGSSVWTKVATAGDAGQNVVVPISARNKSALSVTVYRGVSGIGETATTTDASTSTHSTAPVTVPTGSRVLWMFSDKSGSTSQWTPGPGVTTRTEAYSTGTGRVSVMIGDSGSGQSGVVDGVTATTDVTSSRGITWSITLEPAS